MKSNHLHSNDLSIELIAALRAKQTFNAEFIERTLAVIILVIISPVLLINSICALILREPVFSEILKTDALNRSVIQLSFNHGFFKRCALFINIARGDLAMCGIPLTHSVSTEYQQLILKKYASKPGMLSLFDLHNKTGIAVKNKEHLLLKQINGNAKDWLLLVIKSLLCDLIYSDKKSLKKLKKLPLFGLTLNNLSMKDAVKSIVLSENKEKTNMTFFVNVNSINLSLTDHDFHHTLQQANTLLADGSGIRLAAKTVGYQLNGNNNGTDMLPHLCRSAIENNQSLYFLGASPGVARKAADNLIAKYPELNVVGTQHGYINPNDNDALINDINKSGCHILLVAMGSPMQEKWIINNQNKLNCQNALAVGGLFDFYSGEIARSPMWLRELGLEWVWRLWKEPVSKFKRYVIGNPLFLFRIFILGSANKGVK